MDIKICGATTLDDIEVLQQGGARYVGLWTGIDGHPRNLCDSEFVRLANACDRITPIAVCVKKPLDDLCALLDKTSVRHVQLHGFNMPTDIRLLKNRGFTVIKTVHVADGGESPVDRLIEAYKAAGCDVFLIDRYGDPNAIGSTGQSLRRDVVDTWARRLKGHRIWLAGGLTFDSVADLSETRVFETADIDSCARRNGQITPKATRLLVAASAPTEDFRISA